MSSTFSPSSASPVSTCQTLKTPGPSAPPTGHALGRDPVATITASGCRSSTKSAVTSTPYSTGTSSSASCLRSLRTMHAELVAAGALGGQQHLAAQLVAALVQGDLVPAQRRDLGGPHAGRAAADDHDPLLAQRRPQVVLALGGLAAHRRVLHAADGLVEADAAVAVLVAGDAVADLLRASLARLGDEVGVGDLAADHADHVGLPVGQHPLGHGRVVDAPGGEHRQRGDLLDARPPAAPCSRAACASGRRPGTGCRRWPA